MKWSECAKMCRKVFGSYIDWEERFFECPECGEPLYECDWEDHEWESCPVCEVVWEEIE